MLISFIIPVYNVEQYLRECIDSILVQNFKDYEIILVDDGSKDSSGSICDEYAEKYDFITAVHKENGGASTARNLGLQKAAGDYILFIDSDDYIGRDSLSAIASCLKGSVKPVDLMFLEASKFFSDGTIVSMADGYDGSKINNRPKAEVMAHLSSLPKYPGSACTKMIRRSLILENKLFFEKGISSFEDIDWVTSVLDKAENFAYCNTEYYFYRQGRKGSVTSHITEKKLRDMAYVIRKWISRENKRPYQKEINSFMAYEYVIGLLNFASLKNGKSPELKQELKDLSWVLNYSGSKKAKVFSVIFKLFGFDFSCWLLTQLRK